MNYIYNCIAFLSTLYRRIYTELFYINTETETVFNAPDEEENIPQLNPQPQCEPLSITINTDSDSGFEFV